MIARETGNINFTNPNLDAKLNSAYFALDKPSKTKGMPITAKG